MKRKKLWLILILLFVVCVMAAGCRNRKSDEIFVRRMEFMKMNFPEIKGFLRAFAVSEEGEVFALSYDGKLTWYAEDGSEKASYEDEEFAETDTIVCGNDTLYLYLGSQGKLLSFDPKTKKKAVLLNEQKPGEAENLVCAGDRLYLMSRDTDYHFTISEIDVVRKKQNLLPLGTEDAVYGVAAIYGASDGSLYYCLKSDSVYDFYRYDTKKKQGELVFELEDLQTEDSLKAFVMEQDFLAYITLQNQTIQVVSLADGKHGTASDFAAVYSGKHMQCVAGTIICYSNGETEEDCKTKVFYLPDIEVKEPAVPAAPEKKSGKIKISASSPAYYNTTEINRISGIRARLVQPANLSSYLISIMSGNEDMDIYILFSSNLETQKIKDGGFYVPLNGSKAIQSYKEKCFDYIAEDMTTASGDIWALPIEIRTSLIWYVPENFAKYSLDTSDLQNWERFLELSEKAKMISDCGGYTVVGGLLGWDLITQYDMVYNDLSNSVAEYRTERFKYYFDKMWSGWELYSQESMHPSLRKPPYNGEMIWESVQYQKQKNLFMYDSLFKSEIAYRKENGWRVTGAPKLSDDVKSEYVSCIYAVINPYSKNKDLALAYLETIAENPGYFNALGVEMIFKDPSMYEGRYDFSDSQVQDIYQILKKAELDKCGYPYFSNIVNDYQTGRYTLDEAIEKLQRDTEMWLNE